MIKQYIAGPSMQGLDLFGPLHSLEMRGELLNLPANPDDPDIKRLIDLFR